MFLYGVKLADEYELTIKTLELKHLFVCIFIQGCPAENSSISSSYGLDFFPNCKLVIIQIFGDIVILFSFYWPCRNFLLVHEKC